MGNSGQHTLHLLLFFLSSGITDINHTHTHTHTMAANPNSKAADGKHADLQKDTVDVHDKQHMTTDHGVKISNPDQWLRVVDEKKIGPSLLEDQIAREKVNLHIHIHPHIHRYIPEQTN